MCKNVQYGSLGWDFFFSVNKNVSSYSGVCVTFEDLKHKR